MRKSFFYCTLALGLFALALCSCSNGPTPKDSSTFRGKSGVIGVFREAAFYCSEGTSQYMTLGNTRILVKPNWSSNQDNLFFSVMNPGPAVLKSYEYACGFDERTLTLDQGGSEAEKKLPVGLIVPQEGFCKIFISFQQGDKLFSRDDVAIEDMFRKYDVAMNAADVPYCDMIDANGDTIALVDKDSLNMALYAAAVKDAEEATMDEIKPLISLDTNTESVHWSGAKDRVLLLTLHALPNVFVEGTTLKTESRVLWTVSENEFIKWYKENKDKVLDWNLRVKQLFGLSPKDSVTHFTSVWVSPKYVVRPAYVWDPYNPTMSTSFPEDEVKTEVTTTTTTAFYEGGSYSAEVSDTTVVEPSVDNTELGMWFHNWFSKTEFSSYKMNGKNTRPWTRLGYTYDWAPNSDKYGLTEFLIVNNAEFEVKTTRNIKTYLKWVEQEAKSAP
ncbi:MAG: hypothetical protein HUK21_07800 [Fibrobacteraceae bacterium]|nr:hypothetical protein [Fibrobacteraceae bacterium]